MQSPELWAGLVADQNQEVHQGNNVLTRCRTDPIFATQNGDEHAMVQDLSDGKELLEDQRRPQL